LKVNSGVDDHAVNSITWSVASEGITVRNLPANSDVMVLDMMGKQIHSYQNVTSEMSVRLPQKGMYIMQVKQNQHFQSYKVRF